MPNTQKRLTDAEKALVIHMYSVQGKRQWEIAEHFGVSQASISHLTRRHYQTPAGTRVVRADPNAPSITMREVKSRVSDHLYEIDKVMKAMRATMSLLERKPEEITTIRNGVVVRLHESWSEQTARLCANPTKEDGPKWVGDAIMYEKANLNSAPYWTVEEWAQEHPGTFVYVERDPENGMPDEVWTVEHALEMFKSNQQQENEHNEPDLIVHHMQWGMEGQKVGQINDGTGRTIAETLSQPVEDEPDMMALFEAALKKGEADD